MQKMFMATVSVLSLALFLTACDNKKTEEKAKGDTSTVGEKVEHAGQAVEHAAEKAVESIKEGTQHFGEKVERGAETVKEKVKETFSPSEETQDHHPGHDGGEAPKSEESHSTVGEHNPTVDEAPKEEHSPSEKPEEQH